MTISYWNKYAILTIRNQLGNGPMLRTDHRNPYMHRLDNDSWMPLTDIVCGKHQDVICCNHMGSTSSFYHTTIMSVWDILQPEEEFLANLFMNRPVKVAVDARITFMSQELQSLKQQERALVPLNETEENQSKPFLFLAVQLKQ